MPGALPLGYLHLYPYPYPGHVFVNYNSIYMRSIVLTAMLAAAVFAASCNNSNSKNEHEGHDMSANTTTPAPAEHASADSKDVKAVTASFTDVDANAAAAIKAIVDHYLHVKNALSSDNSADAATGAKAMLAAVGKMDKSLLSAEQKKTYDGLEEGLKEHAKHIADKGDDIKHQRDHFDELSMDVYELVKAFGGGRTLYHDHCPMAKDNQGALWVSETKEIKNPYFGAGMLTCGTVEEVLK